MRPIREVSVGRVLSGETTLQEIERVLGEGDGQTGSPPENEVPRILVVEDEPVVREIAVTILRNNGFKVDQAVDGQAALDILSHDNGYSLVTLDLGLPKIDGRDLLRQLRSAVATATIPVIILTGAEDEATEVELMDQGADDYLRKPLDPARFIARVKAVLRRAVA
jgi:two-component system OmpR family response regulator